MTTPPSRVTAEKSDLSEPRCGKCRWQKKASVEGNYGGSVEIGIRVATGPWDGVDIRGQHFIALGGHYCEHSKQPRGLVLTTYSCPNFEWAPEVDSQLAIAENGTLRISP